ncbi:kelch-like protein 36 [Aplysia californica]|uniref:Kelch-like protein 36 n=1 Tax=Aplysia californica TaxID=6500 RepID=A0ABM0JF40_APLCA|nr:kelch-like protein 36 [Aplysia californica]
MAASNPQKEEEELDDMKLFDEIMIAPHKIKYINPRYKKVNAKMYDYKCDIKLSVGGSNFKAHREVLMQASDYFSAMFSHDMLEKEQDVIELLEMSPNGFTLLLDYFYHGHVTLNPDSIEDVLEAARFFQVDWVVEVCCDYLVHQLSIDNYQTVLQLADKYQLGDLRGDIFRFLGLNVMRLSEEKDFFLNFDRELLTKFLKEDVFVEADEEFVLELITNWVSAKPEERQEYLLPLVRLVRFPLMDADSLSGIHGDLLKWPEVADAVEEAKHYANDIAGQSLFRGPQFMSRGARPTVAMLIFTPDYCTVTYYDIDSGARCQEELAFSGEESQFEFSSIARVGNFLYRSGGYDERVCSSALVYRYNPRYRNWIQLASMAQPRVSHAMCASEDQIFVFGGIEHTVGDIGDEDKILSSAEVYNVRDNVWQDLPELPAGSYNQAASYSDGNVYISGGISADPFDSVPMCTLWRYDIQNRSWHNQRDMLYSRQRHSMTTVGNKLYVFGGYTAANAGPTEVFKDCFSNEVFDIETNQWTEIRPIPETFGHVMRTVGVWNGRFFLFGGGSLHSYYIDEDRMEYGDYVGLSVQKIAVLDVAFPT